MTVPPTALICRHIRLRQFRNFADLELEFPEAGAAIIGDNGSGKTNLLEAVHYFEILRSFRGARDEQLVRFGAAAFHVRGRFRERASGRELEIAAGYEPGTRRKRVTLDGAEVDGLGDAIGRVGTVIFSPSDVTLVSGSPGERRRFLDIVLSLNTRGYLDALQRYRHVLRQRNALLRNGSAGGSLRVWDDALIESGARVMGARAAWIAEHADRYAALTREIGGDTASTMSYDSDVALAGVSDAGGIASAFGDRLARVALRERDRMITLAGPHRDDLSLQLHSDSGAVDLREFGSGGQMRTAAIALRIMEAETVRRRRGFQPLLLLDDVFAELDAGRSRRILELLRAGAHGQVILTAPKETDVRLDGLTDAALVGPIARWRIAAARVFP